MGSGAVYSDFYAWSGNTPYVKSQNATLRSLNRRNRLTPLGLLAERRRATIGPGYLLAPYSEADR